MSPECSAFQDMAASTTANASRSDCLVSADAAEQANDLVGNWHHTLDGERHEGCVAPLCLELGQVGGRYLGVLTGDLERPVLAHCPFDAGRQIERLQCLESFDVLQHVP